MKNSHQQSQRIRIIDALYVYSIKSKLK